MERRVYLGFTIPERVHDYGEGMVTGSGQPEQEAERSDLQTQS